MQNGTIHRLYVGGRYGSGHANAGSPIPYFESHIEHLARKYLTGGTVVFGRGYWQGKDEASAIIETLIDHEADVAGETTQVLALADEAKELLAQDAILHTATEVGFSFL